MTWNKHYCMYTRENKILTMVPYVQTQGKSVSIDEDTAMGTALYIGVLLYILEYGPLVAAVQSIHDL